MKVVKNILQKLYEDDETKFEEITSLGKYKMEGARPMKLTIKSEAITE